MALAIFYYWLFWISKHQFEAVQLLCKVSLQTGKFPELLHWKYHHQQKMLFPAVVSLSSNHLIKPSQLWKVYCSWNIWEVLLLFLCHQTFLRIPSGMPYMPLCLICQSWFSLFGCGSVLWTILVFLALVIPFFTLLSMLFFWCKFKTGLIEAQNKHTQVIL